MIDKKDIVQKRCKRDEFVRLALLVLGESHQYEDELILIKRWVSTGDVEITRKPMSQNGTEYTELLVDNPVTMVANGEVIRHHGEHMYLTKHLEKLVDNLCAHPHLMSIN